MTKQPSYPPAKTKAESSKIPKAKKGRVLTCKYCGESGVKAGGLRKIDPENTSIGYICNNLEKCNLTRVEKTKLLKP
jgi:hypothetical protein